MWSKNKTLKSRYVVRNKAKYMGDPSRVVARSSWERSAFIWCDDNPMVARWASESVTVPYVNPIDKKTHTYVTDMVIKWKDGTVSLVEIKPHYQTQRPTGTRKTKRYIREAAEYVKNHSKWIAASKFATSRGWKFEIWDEHVMRQKGIKII